MLNGMKLKLSGTELWRGLRLVVSILMVGASMSACASTSWKEEVLLHDGKTLVVERSQSHGGRGEIGQSPIKEHNITFTLPGTSKAVTWKDEYSEDVGHSNFDLLALHLLNGIPYIVASPYGCLAYNKWGRPNPPYVFFKYQGNEWKRIPQPEFPSEFKTINLVINASKHEEELVSQGTASAELIKDFNSSLRQPEFKTIMREAVKGGSSRCIKTDYYGKAGWLSPDWFTDQPSLEACLMFCKQKEISAEICPCNSFFKGK